MQPAGNYFDKYNSSNFIIKKIMKGFFDNLAELLKFTNSHRVIDVGCGEGHITNFLVQRLPNAEVKGVDVAKDIIKIARTNYPLLHFEEESIYSLPYSTGYYDLVVSCEVLEHLEQPDRALRELLRVCHECVILSVPREPIWCISNLIRGKYLRNLGNTPGHIQHWSQRGFIDFVSQFGTIELIKSPFPWTMVLLKKEEVIL